MLDPGWLCLSGTCVCFTHARPPPHTHTHNTVIIAMSWRVAENSGLNNALPSIANEQLDRLETAHNVAGTYKSNVNLEGRSLGLCGVNGR